MTLPFLLGLAFVLALAVPAQLSRAQWPARAPALGVLAWEAIAAALVLSVLASGFAMIISWHPADETVCAVWRLCLDALAGAHGYVARVVAWSGLVLFALGLGRLAAAGMSMARAAERRRQHGDLVRLVGRRRPEMGATVIDHPEPAVYLVPGRGEQVVVTTGALSRLRPDELAAVLAHERAHTRGRHHLLLTASGLLHQAFPRVGAFGHVDRQVRQLVEICADDDACRHHSRLALARALVTLGTPAAVPGTLGAGGGEALQRMHRLMDPPPPLPRRTRVAVAVALAALPLLPVAILLAVPAVPALAAGPSLW